MSTELALDKDGYLRDHLAWNLAAAETLAKGLDIELTPEHWQIIELARQFYLTTEVVPETRPLVKFQFSLYSTAYFITYSRRGHAKSTFSNCGRANMR